MSIYPLFRDLPFDPTHIELMSSVFADVSRELRLARRENPFGDLIAKAIIECALRGIRDPVNMRKCAHATLMRHAQQFQKLGLSSQHRSKAALPAAF